MAFRKPRSALINIGRSVMTGDRMLNSPSYTGDNSSYTLRFRAPQFRCNQSTSLKRFSMRDVTPIYKLPGFNSDWKKKL